MSRIRQPLSGLEHQVMRIVWRRGAATADDVCAALPGGQKNATVRTILRRLEQKGYVAHRVDGRAYVYEPRVQPGQAAVGAVRRIIDRFCGGSAEALLVGLLDAKVVKPEELKALSRRVERAQRARERAEGAGNE
jgi:BlaI family transcriptional regulator, penicillinase repressor